MLVADNIIISLQREKMYTKIHNVPSAENAATLLQIPFLSKNTLKLYQTRLLLAFVILTGMRPTAFWAFRVSQLDNIKLRDFVVSKITTIIGATIFIQAINIKKEGILWVRNRSKYVCEMGRSLVRKSTFLVIHMITSS